MKQYAEVEPTFTVERDWGIWIPVVTYARWEGKPETYLARPALTPWGARRIGRREVARIKAERDEPLAKARRQVEELWRDMYRTEERGESVDELRKDFNEAMKALKALMDVES